MELRERRRKQYLLAGGLLFLILGLGNTFYGHVKYKEYKKIYRKTAIEINEIQSQKENKNPLLSSSNAFIEKVRHLKRSHGRITFYRFFVVGGFIFIGISFFILMFTWFYVVSNKKSL